jgi:hypothetical protein
MKRLIINVPAVEAAMLLEVQKMDKTYNDLEGLLLAQIRQEYRKTPTGRASS